MLAQFGRNQPRHVSCSTPARAAYHGHRAQRRQHAEQAVHHLLCSFFNCGIPQRGVVQVYVVAWEAQREEPALQGHVSGILIVHAGELAQRARLQSCSSEAAEKLVLHESRKVHVHGVVQPCLRILYDALHVGFRGKYEIYGGRIRNALASITKLQVQRYAVLSEVTEAQQGRDNGGGELIQNEDFVARGVFGLCAGAGSLVQVQHPYQAFYKQGV